MPTTPNSSARRPRGDGALAGIVRRAASASARRSRTLIALWFLRVVGCFVAGGLAGTVQALRERVAPIAAGSHREPMRWSPEKPRAQPTSPTGCVAERRW